MVLIRIVLICFMTLSLAGATIAPVHAMSQSGIKSMSVEAPGGKRDYVVYVPQSYNKSRPAAVVLVLHGLGGSGEGIVSETGWDRKAEQEGFLAVFPNAARLNADAGNSILTNPQMWNDGSGRGPEVIQKIDDIGYIRAVLGDLETKFSIKRDAVFVTGFSNGASMAFRIACEMNGKITAIAPVSGHYWPLKQHSLTRPVPTLFIAGTQDPLNPLEGGAVNLPWGVINQPPLLASLKIWAVKNSYAAEPKLIADSNGVKILEFQSQNTPMRVYLVHGLGHIWPGGQAVYPENIVGADPKTLNATDKIWEFFAKFIH